MCVVAHNRGLGKEIKVRERIWLEMLKHFGSKDRTCWNKIHMYISLENAETGPFIHNLLSPDDEVHLYLRDLK